MAERGAVRGAYAKSSDTRRTIVEAAEQVFGEVGFRAASMREIARRVEMTVAGVIHQFPDKSALLLAVLARREDLGADFMKFGSDDPIDSVHGAFAVLAYNVTIPVLLEGWVMLAGEAASEGHPARQFFIDHYQRNREGLVLALQRLAAESRLRPGVDPETAANTIVAISDGMQTQFLLDHTIDATAPLRAYLASILASGTDLPNE